MQNGWIKLWRKSIESGLMTNYKIWTFWTWCLLKATHQKKKILVGNQMIELEPGQFVTGRRAAAKELKMSEQTIRTCLINLQVLGNITSKSTNKYTIVSINNWDTYQEKQPTEQPTDNPSLTHDQPATNQQLTTNKTIKELKNKRTKEEKNPPTPQGDLVLPEWIDPELWDAFMEVRKKLKAANTPRALKMLVTELTRLKEQGDDSSEVLRRSITNSWKSVYLLRGRPRANDDFRPGTPESLRVDVEEKYGDL